MYLTKGLGIYVYYKGAQQCHTRAPFLILVQPDQWEQRNAPIRALVRQVALRQIGHWMMGIAYAFKHRISISGAYGADGLPCAVPQKVYDRATPVPESLIEAWNKGGGWNSEGTEASAMRQWAMQTFLGQYKE